MEPVESKLPNSSARAQHAFLKSQAVFAGLVAAVVAGVVYLLVRAEYALSNIGIAPAIPDGSLTDAQETSISLMVTLSTTLINWVFATIGGAGLFLKLQIEKQLRLSYVNLSLITTTLLLAVSSLYFAQLGFDIMIRSLSLQQYPFEHDALFVAFKRQFILGLAAVLALGIQILQYCLTLQEKNDVQSGSHSHSVHDCDSNSR